LTGVYDYITDGYITDGTLIRDGDRRGLGGGKGKFYDGIKPVFSPVAPACSRGLTGGRIG
jgi:hypothetical protein